MTRAQAIVHVTAAGERWDLLAWKYYGDPFAYSAIIMANPSVSIEPQFEAGVIIAIPIREPNDILTSDLPPWKRTQAAIE